MKNTDQTVVATRPVARGAEIGHAAGHDRVDPVSELTELSELSDLSELSGEPSRPSAVAASESVLAQDPGRPEHQFRSWTHAYLRRAAGYDAVIGLLAVLTPAVFSATLTRDTELLTGVALLGALGWPLAVGINHGYERSNIGVGGEELRAVLRAAVTVIVLGAFPAGLLDRHALLTMVVIAVPLAAGGSLAARLLMRVSLRWAQRRGRNVRRVVMAGSAESVQALTDRLAQQQRADLLVLGACVPAGEGESWLTVPVLGNLDMVTDVVRRTGCDAVAVTSDNATRYGYLRKIAWALEGHDVELLVDPGLVEVSGPRMHIQPMLGLPLLHVDQPQFTGLARVTKRILDVALSLAALVVAAPLLSVVALLVKVTDRGPVFFFQERVGRGGRPFTMVKFRSMTVDAERVKSALLAHNEGHGPLFKMRADPRVTRVGATLRRFSIDELPQLFNVLAGSMSLVGPRPHLSHEIALMPAEAVRRSLVTPGMTGLWQVSGRSDLSAAESVRLDLRYVENWSLALDLLILWKTTAAVLAQRGAH